METIIKRFVNYLNNNNNISVLFVKILFNYKYGKESSIKKIVDIKDYKSHIIKTFIEESEYTNYLCAIKLEEEVVVITISPAISLYCFENVLIRIDSSSIIFKNKMLVTRTESERFNEGFLKWHDDKNGKLHFSSIEEIDEGFFLGGNGSWNWFHFTIEILPKLVLLNSEYTIKILVSDIVKEIPSMLKILNYLNKEKFEIIFLKRGQTYKVNKIFHINDFNHVQFNRFDNQIKADGTYFNWELTRQYSDLLLNEVQEINNLPTHIFLYRKNTHRIARNQDEILEYLNDYGFKAICMEDLSFEEQVNYFGKAKFIVGISGAAWSNLIFCRNKPKAICFIPEFAKESSIFSNLAKIFEVRLLNQLYKSNQHHYSSDFEINFIEFKQLFKSLLNE